MTNPVTEKIINAAKRMIISNINRSTTRLNSPLEKMLTLALKGEIRIKKETASGKSVLSDKNATPAMDTLPRYSPAQRADCPRLNIEPMRTAKAENVKEVNIHHKITDMAK